MVNSTEYSDIMKYQEKFNLFIITAFEKISKNHSQILFNNVINFPMISAYFQFKIKGKYPIYFRLHFPD